MSLPIQFDAARCRVRPATLSDLQQVAEVLASSFYPPLGWRRWVYPVFRFSIYEDLKQRFQTMQRHYRCLAAIAPSPSPAADLVVGTVEISYRQTTLLTFYRPKQMYLSNLAVREGCRRRGVARQLLAASEQQALQWGFHELYLHVMADNARARQLYERMGYQLYQVETTLLSLVNAQPPRLLLRKVLSASQSVHPSAPSVGHPLPQ